MSKILIIDEKADMGRNKIVPMIEACEGESFTSKDGYLESSKYWVSWCIGHLLQQSGPEAYGWKEWKMENLPMIPSPWTYQTDYKKDKQLKKIQSMHQNYL